jgi:hypothetical protein
MAYKQNLTNHVTIVLDGSGSMSHLKHTVIKATDELVAYLAQRSKDLDQETRVTIYVFDDVVECIIWDMDVLRLPSIKELYWVRGGTALIDATIQSQQDLALIPTKYGDHAFLTYVMTDGAENRSRNSPAALRALLTAQPENWTPMALVPDAFAKQRAVDYGFPKGNVTTWDISSAQGAEEAIVAVAAATNTFMTNRAVGVRGSRNLFDLNAAAATTGAVKSLGVKPLERGKYVLLNPPAQDKTPIIDMVTGNGLAFRTGMNYYELRKEEKIQADKKIALVRKQRKGVTDADVFVGYEIRDFLGLPNHEVKVGPQTSPDYGIFVQSNSNNRHMNKNMRLLVLEPKIV